jgi:hypothetical protein
MNKPTGVKFKRKIKNNCMTDAGNKLSNQRIQELTLLKKKEAE